MLRGSPIRYWETLGVRRMPDLTRRRPKVQRGSAKRAIFLALVLFADGLFFGVYGALGQPYTGDEITFRVYKGTIGVIALVILANSLLHGLKDRYRPTTADLTYLAVASAVSLSVLIGWVRYPGSEAMGRYVTLFVTLTVPLICLALATRRRDLDRLAQPLVVLSAAVAVLMLVARLRGSLAAGPQALSEGSTSGVGGASHLVIGTAMAAAFSIHLLGLVRDRRPVPRVIHAAIISTALFLVVDSGSRGALVSVVAVTLVTLTLGNGLWRHPVISMAVLMAGFYGWSLLSSLRTTNLGIQKIQALAGVDATASGGRSSLFDVAWHMYLRSPFIGNGVGSFSEELGEYTYPHNLVMELMVDYGTIGLVAAILGVVWFVRAIRSGLTADSQGVNLVAAISLATLVGMMFSGTYLTYGTAWLAVGILALRCGRAGTFVANPAVVTPDPRLAALGGRPLAHHHRSGNGRRTASSRPISRERTSRSGLQSSRPGTRQP